MRRYVFVILFFIVLVTPFVLRSAIGTTSPQAAAPGAGGEPLKLVIVTPHVEGIRREFADAFSAWHAAHYGRPVNIDWRNYGGAAQIVRHVGGRFGKQLLERTKRRWARASARADGEAISRD